MDAGAHLVEGRLSPKALQVALLKFYESTIVDPPSESSTVTTRDARDWARRAAVDRPDYAERLRQQVGI